MAEFLRWLLEKNIRARNAVSALVAFTTVACFYHAVRSADWFRDLNQYGLAGPASAIAIVFMISFLLAWLFVSVCCAVYDSLRASHHVKLRQSREKMAIRANLESLTVWQRRFLLRYIVEQTTQFPGFEVGQIRAVWDFEMEVLIQKGIIYRHDRADVYEIARPYRDYLLDHWNSETGTLDA